MNQIKSFVPWPKKKKEMMKKKSSIWHVSLSLNSVLFCSVPSHSVLFGLIEHENIYFFRPFFHFFFSIVFNHVYQVIFKGNKRRK